MNTDKPIASVSDPAPRKLTRKEKRHVKELNRLAELPIVLPGTAVERCVREEVQHFSGDRDMRVGQDVCTMLHVAAEAHVDKVLRVANEFAESNNRETLLAEDMQRAKRVLGV